MNIVCEVCGDIGYKHILICCKDCKDSAAHLYCMEKIVFDGSLADWLCYECQQRDAGPGGDGKAKAGMTKYASLNKIYSSERSSQKNKHKRKNSNAQTMDNCSNGQGHNRISKGLRIRDMIGTETTKDDNGENQLVDNENSVHSLESKQPTPLIVNCLGYKLGDKAIKGLRRKLRTPKSLKAKFKVLVKKTEDNGLGSKSKTYGTSPVHESSVLEKSGANLSSRHTDQDSKINQPASVGCKNTEVKSGKDSMKVVGALQDKCLAAALLRNNKSEEHNDSDIKAMGGLTPENEKEVVRFQLDYNVSDELQQRSMVAIVTEQTTLQNDAMEGSTVEVETSVEFGRDNPRKRRQLILLDDDDEVEKAGDVQPENSDPRCQCDTPNKNNEIENTVEIGDLSNSNPSDGRPLKKRRRYIDANEDEDDEAVIDVGDVSSAQKDVENCALNDGANFKPQYYIYSRPCDEPVWSGAFKINNEEFDQLDAYLSNKACKKVWDLSRMLQPVVEVMKLPRLQAWPRKWKSVAPTDDCIGLFFFPRSSRPNDESNKLVNKIIECDDALKVIIGVVELLIFPSTLLPEQNKLFQGKHYLWGVFKRIKDKSNRGVLVREQDGLACATEECNLRGQDLLYQQDDIRCKSSGQATSAVKHVMHVENEIVVEHNCLAQKVAMKIAKREGITLTDSKLPSAKQNSLEDGSKCSLHPRIDREFHAPEEMNQHLSSPVLNASSVAKSATECGHGESYSGSGPSTMKLLVTARTPMAQQLIEEMIGEGAVVLSVPEQIEATESCTGGNIGVGSGLNPGTESFDFISTGHGVPDVGSEACLELFPVRQENIAWAPRVEATKEVDLDLSLGARSRAPSEQL